MRSIKFGKTGRDVPVIALGLMRLNGLDDAAAGKYIRKAMELGVTFFDHADMAIRRSPMRVSAYFTEYPSNHCSF